MGYAPLDPGAMVHSDFEDEDSVFGRSQGLVHVPLTGWVISNFVAAIFLVAVGLAEVAVGFMIDTGYSVSDGLPYGSCGAWWAGRCGARQALALLLLAHRQEDQAPDEFEAGV